jgi:hypothetical protein
VVDLVAEMLAGELRSLADAGPFTRCGHEDLRIDAEFENSGGELIYSYEALSPRGAQLLGELASVGFFGAEAQELLAP